MKNTDHNGSSLQNGHCFAPTNYIKIINWFWETVPYIEGYKASSCCLFFAILNRINRNRWKKTDISYGLLINDTRLSKETFIASRNWLEKHNILIVERGKNAYQMTKYSLGIVVEKQTTNHTYIDTTAKAVTSSIAVEKQTTNPTLLKTLNLNKTDREVNGSAHSQFFDNNYSKEDNELYASWQTFIKNTYPSVASMRNQFTVDEFLSFTKKYPQPGGEKLLKIVLTAMENWEGLHKKLSVYKTVLKWIEMEKYDESVIRIRDFSKKQTLLKQPEKAMQI